jgi:hypoxanthine phosphoribosyltransferase
MNRDKNLTRYLFSLFLKSPPFGQKERELINLFSEYPSTEQHDLIKHLLNNFTLLSEEQLNYALNCMRQLVDSCLEDEQIYHITATAFNSDADSSQFVLHKLKFLFESDRRVRFVNTVLAAGKKLSECSNVFLVDEFAGTGETILTRIKHLRAEAEKRQVHLYVKVFLISAMEKAVRLLQDYEIDVHVVLPLKAGISQYFTEHDLQNNIDQMIAMEASLAPTVDDRPLPQFGYGKAEGMYAASGMNTPNSVFPIFWWRETNMGERKTTVFKRRQIS